MRIRCSLATRALAGSVGVLLVAAWMPPETAPRSTGVGVIRVDDLSSSGNGAASPPSTAAGAPGGRGRTLSAPTPSASDTGQVPDFIKNLFGGAQTPQASSGPAQKGAAVVRDENCDVIVDPFELSDNLDQVLSGTAKSAFQRLLTAQQTDVKSIALAAFRDAAKNINWLPVGTEELWGSQMHEQRKPSLASPEGNKKDKRYYATLKDAFARVSGGLPPDLPFRFKLFVLNEDHVDATADPGGYIYVSRAALDYGKGNKKTQAANEQRLDFMLAHEISHVLKRHETRALQAKIIDSIGTIEDLKKLVVQKQANPLSAVLLGEMVAHRFTTYTIDQEMQADTCAIRILTGIKGLGASAPFHAYSGWLSVQNEGYVTSHPSSPDRVHHDEMMIAHFETASSSPGAQPGNSPKPAP